jgi:phosphatidate cytidylyltransferase
MRQLQHDQIFSDIAVIFSRHKIRKILMNNFWQRTITGAFFVAVLTGAVLWSKYSFMGLLFIICLLSLREYARLFKNRAHKPNFYVTIIGGTGIFIRWSFFALQIGSNYLSILSISCLLLPFIAELFKPAEKRSLLNAALALAGILYIDIGLTSFGLIPFYKFNQYGLGIQPYHSTITLGYLILLWSSDTFAYLTGRAFGKTPLAPSISPKKTWEGSFGGLFFTVLLSIVLYRYFDYLTLLQWIGLSVIICVFGIMGDLIESKCKRMMGVKDSGNILPGHGGVLDRFDSLLFSAPFAFGFLILTEII